MTRAPFPAQEAAWREWNQRIRTAELAERDFTAQLTYELWRRRDQLTLCGRETNVYAIFDPTDAVKIGIAEDPLKRAAHVQIGNPRELVLYAAMPATAELERFWHLALAGERLRGEWFAVSTKTLAVVGMIQAAWEQCADAVDTGGEVDAQYAIACIVSLLDEAAVAA